MTINDLIEYSSPTGAWIAFLLTSMGIGMAGLVTTALVAYYKKKSTRGVLTLVGALTITLFMTTVVTGLFVSSDLRKKEETAVAANSKTLKEWAEPKYGITISDKAAERVMGSWGSGWTMWTQGGMTFEAESADGTVSLELKEKADGSFSLIQTGTELKPVDGQ